MHRHHNSRPTKLGNRLAWHWPCDCLRNSKKIRKGLREIQSGESGIKDVEKIVRELRQLRLAQETRTLESLLQITQNWNKIITCGKKLWNWILKNKRNHRPLELLVFELCICIKTTYIIYTPRTELYNGYTNRTLHLQPNTTWHLVQEPRKYNLTI
mgnify:CR=1 FL=1